MGKMSNVTKKHFKKVSMVNLALTAVENVVFLLLKKWDIAVLLGSLWGFAMTCIFFYLICISVPRALASEDPEVAQKYMRVTYIERMLILLVGVVLAFKLPFINGVAALIPLLFTRLSITLLHSKLESEEE